MLNFMTFKHIYSLIKSINIKAKNNSRLIQNFSYLSILQILNLLLPLITYPYLIRILGKEIYGLVIFAQTVISYFVILVNFGFNISATKEISKHRDNYEKLSEIVSSVFIIKFVLFIISIILLLILIPFIPKSDGYTVLFIISMYACFYEVIFPIWYFQGVEQMKNITFTTLISRLIFVILIFVIIKNPGDYLYVPLIYSIGAIVAGLYSLYIVFNIHKIKFKWQKYRIIKYYIVDSFLIFASNVSISIYVNTNKIIIGTFIGMGEVAYYDLAEKITSILKVPQSILSQTIFPKISKDNNLQFIKKLFRLSISFHLILICLVMIFSKQIVLVLGGEQMLPAVWVVNLLILSVPLTVTSNFLGIQYLIPFGYTKIFTRIILLSGLVYLVIAFFILISIGFSIINISFLIIFTELFVTTYMYYYYKKITNEKV